MHNLPPFGVSSQQKLFSLSWRYTHYQLTSHSEIVILNSFFKSEIENVGTKSRVARPSAMQHIVCRVPRSPVKRLGGLGSLNNQISSTRDASALDPDMGFF
ncbi:hypothetical protein Tco_0231198, partial [Tanacetum coccineum]